MSEKAIFEGAASLLKDKKQMKKFAEAMKYASNFGNKASDLAGANSVASEFMKAMEPIKIPMQIVASQIASGSMDGTLELMTSMFNLMEKPSVQRTINSFIDLINQIFIAVAKLTDKVGILVDKIDALNLQNDGTNRPWLDVQPSDNMIKPWW